MKAILKQISIQLKMDVRDKGTLLVFYLVPLGFYLTVGAVFSSVNEEIKPILSATMTIFSVTMGAVIGIPPTIVKIKETGVIRAYKVNGIPTGNVILAIGLSAFIHLTLVSIVISLSAPFLYGAHAPKSIGGYIVPLFALIFCSIAIGLLIGAVSKNTQNATLLSQAVFMPSLMLSGIMFPARMLPEPLRLVGNIFPATHVNHIFRSLAYNLDADLGPSIALAIVLAITVAALILAIVQLGNISRII